MRLDEAAERAEAALLRGPHPERARRDAESLLMHVVRRSRAELLIRWKERLDEVELGLFEQLVHRRAMGEPMQYIFGEAEFFGLPFAVTPEVLIPRPETEHLVERALALAAEFAAPPRILDVGTGSVAVAVALAHHLPGITITAIDLSPGALELARANAAANGVAQSIRFLEGDLLAPVAGERFEMIVSNPPYVPLADRDALSVEVREFEPELALFAGQDGLAVYRRLIPAAFAALTPGGWLLMEIGQGQQAALAAMLAAAGFGVIGFLADLRGIARVVEARRP